MKMFNRTLSLFMALLMIASCLGGLTVFAQDGEYEEELALVEDALEIEEDEEPAEEPAEEAEEEADEPAEEPEELDEAEALEISETNVELEGKLGDGTIILSANTVTVAPGSEDSSIKVTFGGDDWTNKGLDWTGQPISGVTAELTADNKVHITVTKDATLGTYKNILNVTGNYGDKVKTSKKITIEIKNLEPATIKAGGTNTMESYSSTGSHDKAIYDVAYDAGDYKWVTLSLPSVQFYSDAAGTVTTDRPAGILYSNNATLTEMYLMSNNEEVTPEGIYYFRITRQLTNGNTITSDVCTLIVGNYLMTAPTAYSGTYDKETHALLTTPGTARSDSAMKYALGNDAVTAPNSGWTDTIPERTDAGTYYVWYKAVKGDDFASTPACATATINPAEVAVTWSNTELTYTGNKQKPTATSDDLIGGDDVTLSVKVNDDADGVEAAGDYTATAALTGTAAENYTIKTGATTDFTIAPADITGVVAPTAKNRAYDETTALVKAGTTSNGTMMYALGEDGETAPAAEDFSEELPTGQDAGVYYVWYYVKGTTNYKDTDKNVVTVTISPKMIALNWGDTTFTYNGKEQVPTATISAQDIVSGDTVSVSVTGGKTDAGENYTATAALTGTDKGNYVIKTDDETKKFTIEPAKLTDMCVFGGTVYGCPTEYYETGSDIDISSKVTVYGYDVYDQLTAEDYTLSGDTTGKEVKKYTVTATGKGNYTGSVEARWEIVACPIAAVTEAPAAKNRDYDGTSELVSGGEAANGTMMYALGEDDETAPAAEKFSTERPTAKNAGTYYIWYYVKGTTPYRDSEKKCVTVTISPRKIGLTWTIPEGGFVYNGKAQVPTVGFAEFDPQSEYAEYNVLEADKANLGLEASGAQINANEDTGMSYLATATLTGSAAGNYTIFLDKSCDFGIARKAVTVKATAKDKTYDGTDEAELDTLVIEGAIEGETIVADTSTLKLTFRSKEVGKNIAVTLDASKAVFTVRKGNSESAAMDGTFQPLPALSEEQEEGGINNYKITVDPDAGTADINAAPANDTPDKTDKSGKDGKSITKTGDESMPYVWAAVAIVLAAVSVILLVVYRKKRQ